MERLLEGFRRFRESYWLYRAGDFATLAREGQRPRALVIACSDSRVDPQLIFGAAPGEIFVVRNVANLVPPYAPDSDNHGTSAALEFAVRSLDVPEILIVGHSGCGGIDALLRGPGRDDSDFIGPWMEIAAPARDKALAACGHDPQAARALCEREAVKVSLTHLMTFPWVADRVRAGTLRLHGLLFEIESGQLLRLDETGNFSPV